MGRNISIENGASDDTKVSAQVFVVPAVRDSNAGRHLDEQFVDDQSIGAKRDKLLHGQTAVVADVIRFATPVETLSLRNIVESGKYSRGTSNSKPGFQAPNSVDCG